MNNLLIRSQDKKKLVSVNAINILEFEDIIAIHGYVNSETHFWLGTYPTKERALEVLDKIQDILIAKNMISLDYKNALGSNFTFKQIQETLKETSVYQMPKD